MGIRTTDDVVEFFADRIEAHPDDLHALSNHASVSSMSVRGDRIIHYGHFDLAQIVRDKRGRAKLVVLNGDRWGGTGGFGPTTTSRQAQVRRAVELTGVDSIIVPVTALAAAGIAPENIEPIDVRDDRRETERRSSSTKPGKAHVMMDCPDGRTTITSRYAYGAILNRETGAAYVRRDHGWEEWPEGATVPEDVVLHDEQPYPEQPSILDDQDGWRAWNDRYRGTGREVPTRVPLQVPDPKRVHVGRSNWSPVAELGEDGIWRWEVEHHLLGDSLFRARLRETVEVKPSPGQVELYERFMRLGAERDSLGKRLAALAPEHSPLRDWRKGRYIERPSQPRDYREITRRAWAADVLRDRVNEVHQQAEHVRATLDHSMRDGHSWSGGSRLRITRQRTRWAYFLSSFDYQESVPLYFLCELPARVRPTTVEEAIDCLKPPEVVAAEARGLHVTRQGDLFAIPTRLTKRQIRRMLRRTGFQKRLRVLGTNHSVTEGALCKGGAVLGRGTMRHEPDGWRGADHKPQRMGDGKTWHLLVRNTVPRQ